MLEKFDSSQWTQYWSQGNLTTFSGVFEDGYEGEVKEFWWRVFTNFSKKDRVLDLGTGNGALLRLLSDFAAESDINFNAIGIDFANIARLRDVKFSNLKTVIHSETSMENTGLISNSVDHVISQYALEYSKLTKSVPEIIRIMKKHSTLSAIMHSSDSKLIIEGNQYIEQIEYCMKLNLTQVVIELIPIITRIKSGEKVSIDEKSKAEVLRENLNSGINNILDFASNFKDQLFFRNYIQQLTSVFSVQNRSLIDVIIERLNISSIDYLQRMYDMQASRLSKQRITQLKQLAKDNSLEIVRLEPFIYKNSCYGLALEAKKL